MDLNKADYGTIIEFGTLEDFNNKLELKAQKCKKLTK